MEEDKYQIYCEDIDDCIGMINSLLENLKTDDFKSWQKAAGDIQNAASRLELAKKKIILN